MANTLDSLFEIASCEKKYYQKCQINTPLFIVQQLWKILHNDKKQYNRVLDLGAGDGKFALFGDYESYLGIEIDNITKHTNLPKNAIVKNSCAFSLEEEGFDLCIGNPPYVRHQELEITWKEKYSKVISQKIEEKFSQRSNIFVYFLAQSLLKTNKTAKVALIIPFEWATRPSSQSIRNYINKNNWSVQIYRFKDDIFPKVLTTASITIIDKSNTNNHWSFFEIDKDFNIQKTEHPTGTNEKLLKYSERIDNIYAQRGLSPGSQKVFCLTENEREKHNLTIGKDVIPCIVSLKPLSKDKIVLTEKLFYKLYVNSNQRCWLVNSFTNDISDQLKKYFDSIPFEDRNTWTCNNREIWWMLPSVKPPKFLYSSAFTNFSTKIVLNRINAISVNSAFGIYTNSQIRVYDLVNFIKSYDFESRIVNHSGHLKRIEVNQMNSVIQEFIKKV